MRRRTGLKYDAVSSNGLTRRAPESVYVAIKRTIVVSTRTRMAEAAGGIGFNHSAGKLSESCVHKPTQEIGKSEFVAETRHAMAMAELKKKVFTQLLPWHVTVPPSVPSTRCLFILHLPTNQLEHRRIKMLRASGNHTSISAAVP